MQINRFPSCIFSFFSALKICIMHIKYCLICPFAFNHRRCRYFFLFARQRKISIGLNSLHMRALELECNDVSESVLSTTTHTQMRWKRTNTTEIAENVNDNVNAVRKRYIDIRHTDIPTCANVLVSICLRKCSTFVSSVVTKKRTEVPII